MKRVCRSRLSRNRRAIRKGPVVTMVTGRMRKTRTDTVHRIDIQSMLANGLCISEVRLLEKVMTTRCETTAGCEHEEELTK